MDDIRLYGADKTNQLPEQIRIVIGACLEIVERNTGKFGVIRAVFSITQMNIMTYSSKLWCQIAQLSLCPAA